MFAGGRCEFGSYFRKKLATGCRCDAPRGAVLSSRARRNSRLPKKKKDLRDLFGFTITADPGIDTSRQGSGEAELFLDAVKNATVVVDIGANVGFFNSSRSNEHVPVVAVEPNSANRGSVRISVVLFPVRPRRSDKSIPLPFDRLR